MRHVLLRLVLLAPLLVRAARSAQDTSTLPSQHDEAALRALTEQLFAAFALEDEAAFLALWSPDSPELPERKLGIPETFAESEAIRIDGPHVEEVVVEGDRAQVRFEVEVAAVDAVSHEKIEDPAWSRRLHVLRAVREAGVWKVWREGTLVEDLARSLVDAPAEGDRARLLDAHRDLVNDELAGRVKVLAARQEWVDNHTEALRIYEIARLLAESVGRVETRARVALGLSDVRRNQSDFERSLLELGRAARLFEEIGDKSGLAEVLYGMSMTESNRGNYARALEEVQKSLALAEEAGSLDLQLGALMELGQIHQALGDSEAALAAYSRILPMFETLNRRMGIAYTLQSIGDVHYGRGDYASALVAYTDALRHTEAISVPVGQAESLVEIGLVHGALGSHAVALSFFERARAIFERIGAKGDLARTLFRLGDAQRALGRVEEAKGLYGEGLRLSEELGDGEAVAAGWLRTGRLHLASGRHDKARENFQRSLERAREMGIRGSEAESLVALAAVDLASGEPARAVESAGRAAELARGVLGREALWQALTAVGEGQAALRRPQEARAAFEGAIAAVEDLRLRAGGGETEQQRFFENKLVPYHGLIRLLVAQGEAAEAWSVAERTKGRVLADVLSQGRLSVTKTLSAEEREAERHLEREIVSANAQLVRETRAPRPEPDRLERLRGALQKARLDFEAFRSRLYARHPGLQVRRGEPEVPSLPEAAGLLSADTVALEYVVGEDDTLLFVLRGGDERSLRVRSLGLEGRELARRVHELRERLARRDLAYAEPARELYRAVLGPAARELEGSRSLVIVPDGPLWELPFQALESPDGRALLEDHALSYAPSLSVLRAMRTPRQPREPGAPTLLALGNPALAGRTAARAEQTLASGAVAPLPDTERQVRALGRLYGDARSRIYVGAAAREDRVKEEVGRYRILHFATHGLFDDASPLYSKLVLSAPESGGDEDGLLEAREVLGLDLQADLTVLSACETARGRVGAGEGVIGFTWAFFVAGCPSTVVSQWRVEEKSTTELMLEFHRRLRAGEPKAQALRQAALKLQRMPRYRHPFYWAPFVIVGEAG